MCLSNALKVNFLLCSRRKGAPFVFLILEYNKWSLFLLIMFKQKKRSLPAATAAARQRKAKTIFIVVLSFWEKKMRIRDILTLLYGSQHLKYPVQLPLHLFALRAIFDVWRPFARRHCRHFASCQKSSRFCHINQHSWSKYSVYGDKCTSIRSSGGGEGG